jgi:hypothetical protein
MQIRFFPVLIVFSSLLSLSCRHGGSSSAPPPAAPTGGETLPGEAACKASLRQIYSTDARNLTLSQKGGSISNSDYLVGLAVAAGKMNDSCLEFHYQD